MPTRLIREGILTSKRINALSRDAELLYRKILNIADDHGRYESDPMLLRGRCFAGRLNEVTEAMIEPWLKECCDQGVLKLYEVDGTTYGWVPKFKQQLRSPSRFPEPPPDTSAEQMLSTCVANAEQMLSTCAADAEHPCTKANANSNPYANAEADTKYTTASAAESGGGSMRGEISRAGKAPAKSARPKPKAGATPAPDGGRGKKRKKPKNANKNGVLTHSTVSGHTAEELDEFKLAIRADLGPGATKAQIERRFAELTAPRRAP
jgi:hypothetical protein